MKDPLRQTRFKIAETDPLRVPHALAEVAFVGRSNVGKSSTICALCDNHKLAQVSKKPGRTRGINVYEVAHQRWLVDLPGYGFAHGPKKEHDYWPKMIGNYLSGRSSLRMVFVLLDSEIGLGPIDLSMLNWIREKNLPCCIVGTKVDRLGASRQWEYRKRLADSMGLDARDIHWISSKKGYGIKELRQEVMLALGLS